MSPDPSNPGGFDPRTTTRPHPTLLTYYTIISLAALIAFPIVWLVRFFKYETLRYRFDDEGVSMAWGLLFRREINLTYRRIQDIHLTRNLIQRWMGLATVSVQTASGSATPEMQIEGVREFAALRDFLYTRMRGAREQGTPGEPRATGDDEALALLLEIRDELVGVRAALSAARAGDRP